MTGTAVRRCGRHVLLDAEITRLENGREIPTPPGVLTEGLGAVLNQLSDGLATPAATVLLTAPAAAQLGLPARLGSRNRQSHPAVQDAHAAGWSLSGLGRWMTAYRTEGRTARALNIGVLRWLDAGSCQLWHPDPRVLLRRMRRFGDLLGVPYAGTHGGLPGLALLRALPHRTVPRWRPTWSEECPGQRVTEAAYLWRPPQPPAAPDPIEHAWDVRRQYLTAALVSTVAPGQLEHSGPVELVRRNPPGAYLVERPVWAYGDRCPHPMSGSARAEWITAPTADLLYELAEEHGVMAAPTILDSWTAEGGRVLRSWAECIRDALEGAERYGDPVVTDTVKATYRAGLGMMQRETSRVYRPDWAAAVIGMARCLLWRRIWAEGTTTGRWPSQIDADAVWYPAAGETPVRPATFPERTFRHGGTHYADRAGCSAAEHCVRCAAQLITV